MANNDTLSSILGTLDESMLDWDNINKEATEYSNVKTPRSSYDNIVDEVATKHNVDPDLVRAVIKAESGGDPKAKSGVGAQGLMQLMPETAKEMGVEDPTDPVQNIEGGTKYLKAMLDRNGGDITLALAAYNAGQGNVNKYKGVPPFTETQGYVKKVNKIYEDFQRLRSETNTDSSPTEMVDSEEREGGVLQELGIGIGVGKESKEDREGYAQGIGGIAKEAGQSVAGGALGAASSTLQGLEWLTGWDVFGDLAEPLEDFTKDKLTPEHQNIVNDLANGVGSMLFFLVPGATVSRIPALVTEGIRLSRVGLIAAEAAGIAISSFTEATSEAGGVYQTMKLQGKTEEEANHAALETFVYNAALLGFTNKLSGFFDAAGKVGGKFLSGKTLKDAARGFVFEGAQEAGQSVISQSAEGGPINWKQAGYEGLLGGIIGGGAGVGLSYIDNKIADNADKTKGYDPTKNLDLSDKTTFDAGLTQDQMDEAKVKVSFEGRLKQARENAQKRIDEETKAEQDAQERAYAEKKADEDRIAKFTAEKKQAEQNKKFVDTISTKAGLLKTAGELVRPLEESDDPKAKVAAKVIRNADKALFSELDGYSDRKIKDLQYDLNQLAQTTDNQYIGAVASSMSTLLTNEHSDMKVREYEIQRQKELEQDRQRTLKSQGERLRETYGKRQTALTQTAEVTKAAEETRKKEEGAKSTAERKIAEEKRATEQSVKEKPIVQSKEQPMNRLKQVQLQKTLEKESQAKQTERTKEAAERGLKPLSKPEVRFSKGSTVQTTVSRVNKESGIEGLVKYDGTWSGIGEQFTTYKQMGKVPAGQTFVVTGKDVNTVTPDDIRKKLNVIKDKWGDKDHFKLDSDLKKSIGKASVPKSDPAFHDTVSKTITHLNSLVKSRGPKNIKILKNTSEYKGKSSARLSKVDKGMLEDDTIVLFTDNLADMGDAIGTYMHEAVGHMGLKKFMEKMQMDYDKFLMDVYDAVKNTSVFKELAETYKGELKTISKEGHAAYLAEEFLAHRVEKLDPLAKRKLWERIRDFLNDWLTKTFKGEKVQLNMKQVDLVLESATKYFFTGKIRDNLEFARTTEEYVAAVEYMIKNHPKSLTWEENHQALVEKYLGEDAGIFNVLMALTSPGALVKTNAKWAVETYLYLIGKLPVAKSRFPNAIMDKLEKMTGIFSDYNVLEGGVLEEKEKKERKYAPGKFLNESVKSTQFKVAEFIRAMLGDHMSTVNDRWMYRLLFGPSRLTNAAIAKIEAGKIGADDMDAGWTKLENFAARHKLFEITRELNKRGHNVYPAQVQAALWVREVQIAEGNEAMNDYREGLTTPSGDLGGLTPLEYLEKMRGPEKGEPLIKQLKIGKLPARSQLDIEYRDWLKKEGIKPIDLGTIVPALNPAYFADSVPKSLSINGKEITLAEFTGGSKGESILKTKDFGIVTAENPNNTELSEKENLERNKKLVKFMQEKGYDYTPIEGFYNRHEDSFLVFGLTRDQSLEIAKEFEQESVIHNGDLVYQDGTYEAGDLNKINFDGKQTNFFSSALIKGKEVKFSIPLGDERVMKVIHYSKFDDLTEIDPKFMGKGQIGAEKSQVKDWETMELHEGFEKKSNWYVPKDKKHIEGHRFGMLPVYESTINVKDLYTLGKEEQPSDTELKKLGYKGWYSPSDGQVRLFEKVPAKYLGRSTVTKKDFNNIHGGNFQDFIVVPDSKVSIPKQEKIYYTREFEVAETGDIVKVKIEANKALDEVDNDLFNLRALKDCIT